MVNRLVPIYPTLESAQRRARQLKKDRKIGCFQVALVRNERYKVVQVYAYTAGGRIVGSDRGDGKSLCVSEASLSRSVA